MTTKANRRLRSSPVEQLGEVLHLLTNVKASPEQMNAVITSSRRQAISVSDLPDEMPPTPWIFDRFLVEGQPGVMAGPEKSLKTTLLAHMAVCTASGQALFGEFACRNPGPVVMWSGEGGKSYMHDRIMKACAVYGTSHKTIAREIEIQTLTYRINSGAFLLTLLDQCWRLNPRWLSVEPLYVYSPEGWDGSKIATFDVADLNNITTAFGVTPIVGHHYNRGDAAGLRKMSGAGPAEWAGQWWAIGRNVEWVPGQPHSLTVQWGGRAAGGRRVGLDVDDESTKVVVAEAKSPAEEPRATKTDKAYLGFSDVLDEHRNTGLSGRELATRTAALMNSRHSWDISAESLRKAYLTKAVAAGTVRREKDNDGELFFPQYTSRTEALNDDRNHR